MKNLEEGQVDIDSKIEQIKSDSRLRNKNKISVNELQNLDHRDKMKVFQKFINMEESMAKVKRFETKE